MWNTLTPQQQQFLMAMLQRQGGGMPSLGQAQSMPPGAAQMAPGLALQTGAQAMAPMMGQQNLGSGTLAPLANPLMSGGNSALSPQQQAAMLQYRMLGGPQGWGAAANGNVPVWQLLMGRSPWYGQGTSVS